MPTKVRYLRLEHEPGLEFDFFLAEKLGKMVDEIRDMPMDHWVTWLMYYGRRAQAEEMASKR